MWVNRNFIDMNSTKVTNCSDNKNIDTNSLLSIFEGLQDGIVMVDMYGFVHFANLTARLFFNFRKESLVKQVFELPLIPGKTVYGKIKRKTGESGTAEIVCDKTTWHNKPFYLVIVRDVSEIDNLKKELIETNNLKSAGVISSTIGQEFSSMTTVVLGYLSMAKMQLEKGNDLSAILSSAEKATLHLMKLTQQLLSLTKEDLSEPKSPFLPDIIKESIDLVLGNYEDIKCELKLNGNLWPVNIDNYYMKQIFTNLLINVKNFLHNDAAICIEAENSFMESGIREYGLNIQRGKYVKVIISAPMPVISGNNINNALAPYYQDDEICSPLDLAATYSILKKYNGLITVKSNKDTPTSFNLYLPVKDKKDFCT